MTPDERNSLQQLRRFLDRAERYGQEGRDIDHIGRQMEKHVRVIARTPRPRQTDTTELFRLVALSLRTLGVTPNQFLRAFNDHTEAEGAAVDGETWNQFIRGIMAPAERKPR